MAITSSEAEGVHVWHARPNCSLDTSGRRILIGGLVLVSLIVSGGFLLAGAWIVLPFAGLELVALFLAFHAIARRDTLSEVVRLDAHLLSVRSHLADGDTHLDFPTAWARISLEAGDGPDPLVCIRSHGRCSRVGHLMTPEQRRQLYADLSSRLRS